MNTSVKTSENRQKYFMSIIVVLYEMHREAPRTLKTLSADYQRGIESQDYEVIVLDNGSPERRAPEEIESYGENFSYQYVEDADPSPATALNEAVKKARGDYVGLFYDGARMLSPGLLALAKKALALAEDPIVITLGWHLGPDIQQLSIEQGYDPHVEDALLEGIDWRRDGYRLFEISSLAGSNRGGWFSPLDESPGVFMLRKTFERMGGYHSGFNGPAGGMLNLDFFSQAIECPGTTQIVLLGEGTFHQLHGAYINNSTAEEHAERQRLINEQYLSIRGKTYATPVQNPLYFGRLPEQALRFIVDDRNAQNSAATDTGIWNRIRNRFPLSRLPFFTVSKNNGL